MLTHADAARTIVARSRRATLCTLQAGAPEGHPYGSLVEHAPGPDGQPLLLLSQLAQHTRNLACDPRASVLISDALQPDAPLADGRVTLLGAVTAVEAASQEAARDHYLAHHPSARGHIDFADFTLYQLQVSRARYIGGFGRMSWLDASAYLEASPDPLAEAAPAIIEHMNEDHADALVLYCRAFTDADAVTRATMVWVDQLGFDVVAQRPDAARSTRHRFEHEAPAATPQQVRARLVERAAQARERLGLLRGA